MTDIEMLLSGKINHPLYKVCNKVAWNKGMTGVQTHSAESRAKIGAASKIRNRGKKPSAETCAKISAILKSRCAEGFRPVNVKPVMTPKGLFPSTVLAAKACGFGYKKLRRLMIKFPNEYYYA
jgi:hypothetical protein